MCFLFWTLDGNTSMRPSWKSSENAKNTQCLDIPFQSFNHFQSHIIPSWIPFSKRECQILESTSILGETTHKTEWTRQKEADPRSTRKSRSLLHFGDTLQGTQCLSLLLGSYPEKEIIKSRNQEPDSLGSILLPMFNVPWTRSLTKAVDKSYHHPLSNKTTFPHQD